MPPPHTLHPHPHPTPTPISVLRPPPLPPLFLLPTTVTPRFFAHNRRTLIQWYYKSTQGGDFDAALAALKQAASQRALPNPSTTAPPSPDAPPAPPGAPPSLRSKDPRACNSEGVGTVGGEDDCVDVSVVEEGPETAGSAGWVDGDEEGVEGAGRECEALPGRNKGGKDSDGAGLDDAILRDLQKGAEGGRGEEVSPYDVPTVAGYHVPPWWNTKAWEERTNQFRASLSASSSARARDAARSSHAQHEAAGAHGVGVHEARWRTGGGDVAGGTAVGGGPGAGGAAGVVTGVSPADSAEQFSLSQTRASFPKSFRGLEGAGGVEVGRAGASGGRAEGGGEGWVGGGQGGAGGPSNLDGAFLANLAAVEKEDKRAQRRMNRMQERMTPKGFKGGTILSDRIDFGGGKGADAAGERFT
jgi:hypothetical protein